MEFSSLDNFFSADLKHRDKMLYDWGQANLLPLKGKELEKACADLTLYFRNHPEANLCKNLILPELYWRDAKENTTPNHYHLNYGFKEYLMNVIVYKKCEYIRFTDDNNIEWDNESKKPRFIYRDTKDRKTNPEQTLSSGYTLKQKDIVWAGIAVGFLDVPAVDKSSKKTKASDKTTSKDDGAKTTKKKAKSKNTPKEEFPEETHHEIYDENHNINNAVTDKSLDSIDQEQLDSEGHEEYEYYIQSNNHKPIHEKAEKLLKKPLVKKELPNNDYLSNGIEEIEPSSGEKNSKKKPSTSKDKTVKVKDSQKKTANKEKSSQEEKTIKKTKSKTK